MSHEAESTRLQGRTAVVTGSSSGVGRAIALQLAADGSDVLIHGRRRRGEAEAVAEEVRRLGRRSEVILCDLAERGDSLAFCEAAWNWGEGIDIWVNNAGADVLTGGAAELSFFEKLDLLWRVDVCGSIALSREIGSRMRRARQENTAAGGGDFDALILNVGWDQVEHGMAGDSGEMFAAIKGAVMAFTKSLAHSLAPDVRVNCIAPGWIRTAWGDDASDYWQQRARRESLLDRWGAPEDVAGVAAFLASPQAAFLTGQVINVNGGFRHGE